MNSVLLFLLRIQVGTNGTEVTGCPSPGEDYVFRGSRLSAGLFYREDAESKSFEEAEQMCSASGAHLPTFKTQEEYEILLELLGEEKNYVSFPGRKSGGRAC